LEPSPSNLQFAPPPLRFAGGPSLETADPNHLEQIQQLPASIPLRAIAMKLAPKTSNPLVIQYLAQRFKQDFKTVDYPVNPIHQQTLLHIVVSAGRPKLVEVLLNAGANPLVETKNRENALDWAESKMSRGSSPADRQAIQQMLFKRVKELSRQPKPSAGPLPNPATQSVPDAGVPSRTTSWLSGWGLGALLSPLKSPQKTASDAISGLGHQPERKDSAPSTPSPKAEPDQKELAQLEQTQQLLQTRLSAAQGTIKQLEQTTRQALEDRKRLEQEKKKLETALEQLQERVATTDKETSQLQAEATRELKRLSQKEESLRKRLEQKTEALKQAEQTLQAQLAAQQEDFDTQQRSYTQQIATLRQQLAQASTPSASPSAPHQADVIETPSPSETPVSRRERKKTGKMYAKIRELQSELTRANERGQSLSEQLTLVQEQYRDWIARLLREKESLNVQLAQTQWQRDESALILPQVHQANEQLVANVNQQGQELQMLRQTVVRQQAALDRQKVQLAQQTAQIQAQAAIIQQQKAQKNTLSKTVKHLMALNTSHHQELQRQELSTYHSMLALLGQKQEAAASEPPTATVLAEVEADLKQLIHYRRQQMGSHTVLSTALASIQPSETEESSDAETPSAARRFPLRSRSFR
jgi:predicted  nucleic acid-binding Zn-ribbon protein